MKTKLATRTGAIRLPLETFERFRKLMRHHKRPWLVQWINRSYQKLPEESK